MKKHPRLSVLTAAVSAASLFLMSSVALAGHNYKGDYKNEMPCPPPKMLKDGFYLGAQVGYEAYRVRESSAFDIPPLAEGVAANPAVAATGWVGGLFLGYGQYLTDLFYLGGEIFGNYSGADESHSFQDTLGAPFTYNTKIEARGSYGLALLPGIRLNDATLGYIRLGWNWVNLKASESVTTPGGGTLASASKSNTSNGFNYGVGIETLLVDNWSVRGEFTHTSYSDFSTAYTSYDPSDNQYMLGLIYHFA